MRDERIVPDAPAAFIRDCVLRRRVFWTHHINMRMGKRRITREMILESAGSYEVIENYPDDKYLPSFLTYACHEKTAFHVLFATDVLEQNVRVVTAYYPDPQEWTADLKTRIKP